MKFVPILMALCLASAETRVNRASLVEIEGRLNDTFRTAATDPYDLLGTARGTYIEGYGALFTVELNLVYVTQMSPFRPAMTKDEIEKVHAAPHNTVRGTTTVNRGQGFQSTAGLH